MIISKKLATLQELKKLLTIEEAMQLYSIIYVDDYNEALGNIEQIMNSKQ